MKWEMVMGLEVHAQLKTSSKLFSGAAATFGAHANTQTSFLDAGLPGTLPVVNHEAIKMAIRFGLAINAEINNRCYFERKNYFYPDLPKGYQISQMQRPIVSNGFLDIKLEAGYKKIIIERAHLEEDAGKSLHNHFSGRTGIDLNRAGTPLLEIVTTPCFSSAEEVVSYLKSLHQLVRFLGICDGNMQEGSFRCDVNISLKPEGSSTLGTRTELKNINSFRYIEKAIAVEQARQHDLLEQGLTVKQETRSFCPHTETTRSLRSKERAEDYRYFPDPDLLPILIDSATITQLKNSLPALPQDIQTELEKLDQLSTSDVQFLLSHPDIYYYFSRIKEAYPDVKPIVNWLSGAVAAKLNATNQRFSSIPIPATLLAEFLAKITEHSLSNTQAKLIFDKLWQGETDLDALIQGLACNDIPSENLEILIHDIIKKFPQQALDYQAGKTKLLAFFVGQIMKESKGKADPEIASKLFISLIN